MSEFAFVSRSHQTQQTDDSGPVRRSDSLSRSHDVELQQPGLGVPTRPLTVSPMSGLFPLHRTNKAGAGESDRKPFFNKDTTPLENGYRVQPFVPKATSYALDAASDRTPFFNKDTTPLGNRDRTQPVTPEIARAFTPETASNLDVGGDRAPFFNKDTTPLGRGNAIQPFVSKTTRDRSNVEGDRVPFFNKDTTPLGRGNSLQPPALETTSSQPNREESPVRSAPESQESAIAREAAQGKEPGAQEKAAGEETSHPVASPQEEMVAEAAGKSEEGKQSLAGEGQTSPTQSPGGVVQAPAIAAPEATEARAKSPEGDREQTAPAGAFAPTQSPTAASTAPTESASGAGAASGGATEVSAGGEVSAPEVDEDAEAEAMEARLAEVSGSEDSGEGALATTESTSLPPEPQPGNFPGSEGTAAEPAIPAVPKIEDNSEDSAGENPAAGKLSAAEKSVAIAALSEDPVPGGSVGGGGGGSAIAEREAPPAPPDVSQSEPSAALAAVSGLPPARLLSALGSIQAAVSGDVGKQRAELAANPPQAGTPSEAASPAPVRAPAPSEAPPPVTRIPEKEEKPTPAPAPLPADSAPPQVVAPAPAVRGNEEGKMSDADVSQMQASLGQLPTSPPGVSAIAGPPPQLALEGNADPQQAREQQVALEGSLAALEAKGKQELAQPTGIETIRPTLPQQTLTANVGAGGAAAAGAAIAGGESTDEAAALFAQQEQGGEIQAAAAKAQSDLAAQKQEHAAKVAAENAQATQNIELLKQENRDRQDRARSQARGEVESLQAQSRQEQDALIAQSRQEADSLVGEGLQEVESKRVEGEAAAAQEMQKGEAQAEAERQKGEAAAAQEKAKGENQSSGLFSWLASKAKAFFDGIKNAIQKAFEAARTAMRKALEAAQKLAAAAIEQCRKAIVAVIRRVGDALVALGDRLLARWPGLCEKWRNAIAQRVQQAEEAVNKIAATLNEGLQKALDALGGALDAALGLLEKGMQAAVSAYANVVAGAIKLGEGIAKTLGAFAVLAKDIASNPGQWVSNLGASVSDGIQNHLWGAFKEQVQAWFNQKLESILGLGAAVWQVLTEGGISMAEIGQQAWTAVKQAMPTIVIGVLLERLVSMIVPGVGAVLAIIQGLQAAWGTVSQIIQAFGQFMTFLKAVKTGAAGPQFGALLASAAVVAIEFISGFIIVKIAKAARKVAGKLKGLAKSLMKRGKGKKGKKGKKGEKDNDKDKDKPEDKKQKDAKQEKLRKAVTALKPKVKPLLDKGVSGIRLKAQLALWRARYRLTALSIEKQGNDRVRVIAKVNPEGVVEDGYQPEGDTLLVLIRQVAKRILDRKDVKAAEKKIGETRTETPSDSGKTITHNHNIQPREGWPALGKYLRKDVAQEEGSRHRPLWSMDNFTVGQSQSSKGTQDIVVPQQKAWRDFITKKRVGGKMQKLGHYDPDIRTEFQKLRAGGHGDDEIAIAMRALITRGSIRGFRHDDAQSLGAMTELMFGLEVARNSATIVTAPMLSELVAAGEMTWDEALEAFPMSPEQAVKKADSVHKDLADKVRSGKLGNYSEAQAKEKSDSLESLMVKQDRKEMASPDEVEATKRQEENIVVKWLKMKMETEKPIFDSQRDAMNYIERKIAGYYGLGHN